MTQRIAEAHTDAEIAACFPVMSQLRPKVSADEFVPMVRRLAGLNGFMLAFLDDGAIRAVAGYRISEWLAGGRYLEIEDLVTAQNMRSKGYGGALFEWLVGVARRAHCQQVRLVSNVRRVDAHRFYVRQGMTLEAHYFALNVPLPP